MSSSKELDLQTQLSIAFDKIAVLTKESEELRSRGVDRNDEVISQLRRELRIAQEAYTASTSEISSAKAETAKLNELNGLLRAEIIAKSAEMGEVMRVASTLQKEKEALETELAESKNSLGISWRAALSATVIGALIGVFYQNQRGH